MTDNDTKLYLPVHTVDNGFGSRLLKGYARANMKREPNLELRMAFLLATMVGASLALWLL